MKSVVMGIFLMFSSLGLAINLELEGEYRISLTTMTDGERIHCIDQVADLGAEIIAVQREGDQTYFVRANLQSLNLADAIKNLKCVSDVTSL